MYNNVKSWWILHTWTDQGIGAMSVCHASGYVSGIQRWNEPLRNTLLLQLKKHLGTEHPNLLKLMSNRWLLNAQISC